MRVPLSWLREIVPVQAPVGELAARLSSTGTHVDSVEEFGKDVSGVVAARVLEVADVPESDKLCISQLEAGDKGRFQVVAGAKNFTAGDIVPLATPGGRVTTIPSVGVRRMVSGKYESQGMLCSAAELGMSDDHSGILVLPPDTAPGADVVDLLGLRDSVFEFEIYPNRPDLLSIRGIAREVALLFGIPLAPLDGSVEESATRAADVTSVDVLDATGCPRYLARVVDGVSPAKSPVWVQTRLSRCGVRPINAVVDATNYVLLLTGQPLHAFDLDRLAEHRIVVRRARDGEEMTTLDDQRRRLSTDDLVIADARDAQAVAGIMGGSDSEVGPGTKRILLESAYFDPASVRQSARTLAMRSEASYRFERGCDPEMVPVAAALCARLIATWAGGSVLQGAVDVGEAPERRRLELRRARVPVVLGMDVPTEDADRYLTGLGCDVQVSDAVATVTAPSWRPDLEREIDLIEEIARVHGYDRFPQRAPTGPFGFLTDTQLLRRRVRDALLGAGLFEAQLTSFVASSELRLAGSPAAVALTNPMTEGQAHLRPSLLPAMLLAGARNVSMSVQHVRLFEIGTVFVGWPEGSELPDEELHVAALITGDHAATEWHTPARPVDAFDARGLVELLLDELGIRGWTIGPCDQVPFHPGRSATVMVDGRGIGRFGELRPSLASELDLPAATALLELDLGPLLARAATELRTAPLPRMPAVTRDIALIAPDEVAHGDIEATIRRAGGDLLESVAVFDTYRGDPVPAGSRSLAYRLTFRAADRTLTSAEADEARAAVAEAIRTSHRAEIR